MSHTLVTLRNDPPRAFVTHWSGDLELEYLEGDETYLLPSATTEDASEILGEHGYHVRQWYPAEKSPHVVATAALSKTL